MVTAEVCGRHVTHAPRGEALKIYIAINPSSEDKFILLHLLMLIMTTRITASIAAPTALNLALFPTADDRFAYAPRPPSGRQSNVPQTADRRGPFLHKARGDLIGA